MEQADVMKKRKEPSREESTSYNGSFLMVSIPQAVRGRMQRRFVFLGLFLSRFNTVNGKRVHATGKNHVQQRRESFNTVNGKRVHATEIHENAFRNGEVSIP